MLLLIVSLIFSITASLLTFFLTPLMSNWVNCFWIILFIIGYFVLFYIIYWSSIMIESIFIKKQKEHPYINNFYYYQLKMVASFTLLFFNASIKKKNFGIIPKNKPFLVVFNHTSGFDPLVVLHSLKDYRLVFVSKKEAFDTPFVGNFMRGSGTLSLNRDDLRDAVKVLKQSNNYILNENVSVAISPEGTRSKDGNIQAFHPGSFKTAFESKCPVVLLKLDNVNKIYRDGIFKKTKVNAQILKVYYPKDYINLTTSEFALLVNQDYR